MKPSLRIVFGLCLSYSCATAGSTIKDKVELWDSDYGPDDRVASLDWQVRYSCAPETGNVVIEYENANRVPDELQGANVEAKLDTKKIDDHHYEVTFTGLGTWTEWSLWGAVGSGIVTGVGAGLTAAGLSSPSGPPAVPIGVVAGVGGAIVGAITFRDKKTATYDTRHSLRCITREDAGQWFKYSNRIYENLNDSTGDLYWKKL